ncbi:MAG: acylneuraminate cytidylyltransferase family protein [Burkholderiales bacterium]
MIAGRSVLAIIPARGGSKGVPRKNIRKIAGRPLLGWTLLAAQASRYVDRVVLSSEDDEIIAAARNLGCEAPFRRPAELASDTSPGIDPVLHALAQLPPFDLVVLLQPTSPLRIAADIDGCLELLEATGAPACVSVREATDHPYWTYRIDPDGLLQPFVKRPLDDISRRQDLPHALALNGAVYVARVPWLIENRTFLTVGTVGLEMPAKRSLDVDTEEDLVTAERVLMDRADLAPDDR